MKDRKDDNVGMSQARTGTQIRRDLKELVRQRRILALDRRPLAAQQRSLQCDAALGDKSPQGASVVASLLADVNAALDEMDGRIQSIDNESLRLRLELEDAYEAKRIALNRKLKKVRDQKKNL